MDVHTTVPTPAFLDVATTPDNTGGAARRGAAAMSPMLVVKNLKKHFPIRGGLLNRKIGAVHAVDDISFTVFKGETLGVVGESGCGKSTLARLLMYLTPPDSGGISFQGHLVGESSGLPLRDLRRSLQMVFQDSYSSLNPRLPVEASVAYGPRVHGASSSKACATARELLGKVGLKPEIFGPRYPHELSGGQKQRVNIARALALQPKMLILDEAVSALDKSVEAQVLNLLRQLKREFDLTYLFISHDLNVVQYISDRVMVMYLGQVVELGPVDQIYHEPKHPYTAALLQSRLAMDPDDKVLTPPLTGDPPSPINPAPGCRFRSRCQFAEAVCEAKAPTLEAWANRASHVAACHMADPQSGHSRAGTPASQAVKEELAR
ncbi:ABC transporter ATP-binding protein [Ensifer sp. NPDC090286]|uniref:ABC transporter ATP-binding protein n=1 Tax=Ensifer sp. NPDC090286 TaxID=3363991 RepID=UPI00383B21D8